MGEYGPNPNDAWLDTDETQAPAQTEVAAIEAPKAAKAEPKVEKLEPKPEPKWGKFQMRNPNGTYKEIQAVTIDLKFLSTDNRGNPRFEGMVPSIPKDKFPNIGDWKIGDTVRLVRYADPTQAPVGKDLVEIANLRSGDTWSQSDADAAEGAELARIRKEINEAV